MELYQRILNRAFRILAARPRSVADMRTRLLEKPWADEETVDAVIARLVELNYLDDGKYAEQLVNSKLAEKPLGRTRLKLFLRRKSVPGEQIEAAVETAFADGREAELLNLAIARRTRTRGVPASREEAQKLLQHLMRQGFPYDLAMRKIRELPVRDQLDEESS